MSKLRKWMMKEERDTISCGSGDLSSSAIKLFGKTIAVSASADSSVSTKAGSEEVDGASTQLEGENLGSSPGSICSEAGSKEVEVLNGDSAAPEVVHAVVSKSVAAPLVEQQPESNPSSSPQQQVQQHQQHPQPEQQAEPGNGTRAPQRALTQEEKKEQCLKKPDKLIPCPRCESVDTKFCYYNNYNINQPRHFCKSCQRYWTAGGTLRNVLVGAGRRKNKYSVGSNTKPDCEALPNSVVRADHHEAAQQQTTFMAPVGMSLNSYTLGTVPPMNLPRHGQSPRTNNILTSDTSTITTMNLASAFKPLGSEVSSDSVSKLRQRTQPEGATKNDCGASSGEAPAPSPTYVLTPRAPPDVQHQAVWTKAGVGAGAGGTPVGFFNGAWPYGYNIGWSGAPGAHSGAHAHAGAPVWTGMWAASAAPVPAFGWNMLQGGWTIPWRPVPAVGVQMQQSQSQGATIITTSAPATTTTTSSPRKRESSTLVDSERERGKLARVGSGEEVVAV